MSRHRSSGGYGHRLSRVSDDHWIISWVYDKYYSGDRLRYPRGVRRSTDFRGATRYAKKWGLPPPERKNDGTQG